MDISSVCMEPLSRYIFVTCNLTNPITSETIVAIGNKFDNGTDDVILKHIDDHTVIVGLNYNLPQSVTNIVIDQLRFADRKPANVIDKFYSKLMKIVSDIRE